VLQTKQSGYLQLHEDKRYEREAAFSISLIAMVRGNLEEISLNGQGIELELSDSEASAFHEPSLKDAIVSEGQEALWIEDDVSAIFRTGKPGENQAAAKKTKFNRLFRGKKKKSKKSVVLLPQENMDENSDDENVEEVQQSPVDDTEENVEAIQKSPIDETKEDVEAVKQTPVDDTQEHIDKAQETPMEEKVEKAEEAEETPMEETVENVEDVQENLIDNTEENTEEVDQTPSIEATAEDVDQTSVGVTGQEALWVEDLGKKKTLNRLFRGKKNKTKKSVVLLPQENMDENANDENAEEVQQTPVDGIKENAEEVHQTPIDDTKQNIDKTQATPMEEKVDKAEEVEETPMEEIVENVEDVQENPIDNTEENTEEVEQTPSIEATAEDVDRTLEQNPSDVSSLGLKTDTFEYGLEYGFEVAEKSLPSSGKAIEIVGIGPMMMEAETIQEPRMEGGASASSKQKKSNKGLFGIFRSKPKQSNAPRKIEKENSGTTNSYPENPAPSSKTSPSNSLGELRPFSPKSVETKPHPADRYSVAPVRDAEGNDDAVPSASEANEKKSEPNVASGENEKEEASCENEKEEDWEQVEDQQPSKTQELPIETEEEEEAGDDDRYRIGPPKRSMELNDDVDSYVPREKTVSPYRDGTNHEDKSLLTTQDIPSDIEAGNSMDGGNIRESAAQSAEDIGIAKPDDATMIYDTSDGGTLDSSKKQTDSMQHIEEKRSTQQVQSGKRKNRLAGIFGGRKNKSQSKVKKTARNKKGSSMENAPSMSGSQSDQGSKSSSTTKSEERSKPSSIKGESMTVIEEAVNKGSLMAQESNLEQEASLISRRLRPTLAGSNEDVIDLIRERTRKNNGKGRDPLDSTTSAIQMSVSKDPAGKALNGSKKDHEVDAPKAKNAKKFMSQAPTPRAKKVVESIEKQHTVQAKGSHQQQITRRLYGTPTGKGQMLSSKKVYIGDLVNGMPGGVSTDPTVDSAVSEENKVNEQPNVDSVVAN
jgi:hypothetical protein